MPETSATVAPSESELATAALRFARRVHLGQYRKQTYEQFVEHPIAVARCMHEAGYDGPLLAAAYLHDVVEKTPVEAAEIRERFGPEVADVVEALSDDETIEGYGARKRDLRRQVLAAGRGPVLIYAADRVANLRDWRRVAPEAREACAGRLGTNLPERIELWAEDLEELTAFDPELPFLAEIEISLRALRAGE
ncbi:MAG TPA: HD domain-containing protein [Solirubrobacterales bacterium]|jgi:GTP pyrophosphokinase|nr:HD domain-containing protein [Solirubrobacterales bacterium]